MVDGEDVSGPIRTDEVNAAVSPVAVVPAVRARLLELQRSIIAAALADIEGFPDFAGAVAGARAVDVGASTGGFTQVLLERGATHVVALDVGHGQLAEPVKSDPRVTDLEGLNIRDVVSRDKVDGSPFDLVVSDLSFISLTLALPHMNFLLAEAGHLVVLVKPQFEVGRERLGRTGVVTSRDQRRESLERVLATATGLSLVVHGIAWSPMVGTHGNHEYLVWLRRVNQGSGLDDETLRYLRQTGRSAEHCAMVEAYCRRQGLWFDPGESPVFTETVEMDLAEVEVSVAGPRRPQDRIPASDTARATAAMRGHAPLATGYLLSAPAGHIKSRT